MVEGNKEIQEILNKIENLTIWDKHDLMHELISKEDDLSFLNDYIDWCTVSNKDIIDEVEKRDLYDDILDDDDIIGAAISDKNLMKEILNHIDISDLQQIFDDFGCDELIEHLSDYFDYEFDESIIDYLKRKLKRMV